MTGIKLQKIDESLIAEHSCLTPTDRCFFLGEYASRQGYQHSPMNQLIFNFKKPLHKTGQADWPYKENAVLEIAQLITSTASWHKLKAYTWIPIPPSVIKTEKEYDDRLLKVLAAMHQSHGPLDIREILLQKNTREASHATGDRQTIKEHLENWFIDTRLLEPAPKHIAIFDDVITTGASFKAAQLLLQRAFPQATIIGLFVARAVFP